MLILKSFFRKKTTRTYFAIYTLLLLVLMVLLCTKIVLEDKENSLYNGSYIIVNSSDNEKLKEIKNIKDIKETIVIKEDYDNYVLVYNRNYELNNNEVIISSKLKESININENIDIVLNDLNMTLLVKNYENNNTYNIFYISNELYDKLKNVSSTSFIITLKNWQKYENTLQELRKYYKSDNVMIYYNKDNSSYETFIIVVNVILIALFILFSIVLIMTCFNLIEDEKIKNKIYYKLGYPKKDLRYYVIFKIILLMLVSIVAALFLLGIIMLIYKTI